MNDRDRDQALALAGIFQAAGLVQQLAREGQADADAFAASIDSILAIDTPNTAAVYGGAQGVTLGLTLLRDKLLKGASPRDLEIARYVLALIQLGGVLKRQPDVAALLQSGIRKLAVEVRRADTEVSDDDEDDPLPMTLCTQIADLYARTLSTLTPRIMVSGEPKLIANGRRAACIRTALLAGVRSAILWQQLGGARWHLLFSRDRLALTARALLERRSDPAS